jgi:hypothetical protein
MVNARGGMKGLGGPLAALKAARNVYRSGGIIMDGGES